MVEHEGILKKI